MKRFIIVALAAGFVNNTCAGDRSLGLGDVVPGSKEYEDNFHRSTKSYWAKEIATNNCHTKTDCCVLAEVARRFEYTDEGKKHWLFGPKINPDLKKMPYGYRNFHIEMRSIWQECLKRCK